MLSRVRHPAPRVQEIFLLGLGFRVDRFDSVRNARKVGVLRVKGGTQIGDCGQDGQKSGGVGASRDIIRPESFLQGLRPVLEFLGVHGIRPVPV